MPCVPTATHQAFNAADRLASVQAVTLDGDLRGPDGGAFLRGIQAKAELLEMGAKAGLKHAQPGLHARGLLFAGMGGSGASAGLVRDAVTRVMEVPFTIVQHYQFPGAVTKDWHVLAISYSGETEETLTLTREAKRRGVPITAFSSGGSIVQLADRHIPQPTGYAPRCALGHTWMSLLGFLQGSGLLQDEVPVQAAAKAVREMDATCGPGVPEAKNEAKQLARRLADKIPHIYCTPAFYGVGVFFRSLLNENAKKIANVDLVPECNHNDINGWGGDPRRDDFTVLALSHPRQNPEMLRRLEYMRQRYTSWGVPWHDRVMGEVGGFASHVVEQARALQLLDYTSYYVAMLRGVDPNHIPEVKGLKAFIRQT